MDPLVFCTTHWTRAACLVKKPVCIVESIFVDLVAELLLKPEQWEKDHANLVCMW
jgi:hypothetical protein